MTKKRNTYKIDIRVREYYDIVDSLYKHIKAPTIKKNKITERIMRIGFEARYFNIKADDIENLEYIAEMTIKKDLIESFLGKATNGFIF